MKIRTVVVDAWIDQLMIRAQMEILMENGDNLDIESEDHYHENNQLF